MEPSSKGINVEERALWWKYSRKSLSPPPIWPLTRWRGAGRCERWSAPLPPGLALLMPEKRRERSSACAVILSPLFSTSPRHTSPRLVCDHCSLPLTSAATVRGETQNENKWGAGKAFGQCACLCARVCMCTCLFYRAQISSSAAVSRCGAKRPSRDSSSTCCWAPQGMDWALQAGILSIQSLQAAWETGDGATDSLCLLVYCWASVLGGTAGLTGAFAN